MPTGVQHNFRIARHPAGICNQSVIRMLPVMTNRGWRAIMVSCKSRPGAQDHEYLSEVDFLLREDGSRQVLSSKKICGSRKCCPSCAGRASRCSFPWRDHRHSGIRRPLLATEERAHASHLRSLVERDFRGARFRGRYPETEGNDLPLHAILGCRTNRRAREAQAEIASATPSSACR